MEPNVEMMKRNKKKPSPLQLPGSGPSTPMTPSSGGQSGASSTSTKKPSLTLDGLSLHESPENDGGNDASAALGGIVADSGPDAGKGGDGGNLDLKGECSTSVAPRFDLSGKELLENIQETIPKMNLSKKEKDSLMKFITAKREMGEIKEGDVTKISEIGYGCGGVVDKVQHKKTGTVLARKTIHLEVKPTLGTQVIKELRVLNYCSSPYIVGFYWSYFSQSDKELCVFLEYMDGQSLDKVVERTGRIDERLVGKISMAVLSGLIYLKEDCKFLHRDVKPSNILINSEGEIKLCDFGVSGTLTNSLAHTFVGTRSYMAPERLSGEEYTVKSDIWSFGMTLIELAIGFYPLPAPKASDYDQIFAANPQSSAGAGAGAAIANIRRSTDKVLSIFDQLQYIVNEPAAKLPSKYFTAEFVGFTDICLIKETSQRADLRQLDSHAFIVRSKQDTQTKFAEWVKSIVTLLNAAKASSAAAAAATAAAAGRKDSATTTSSNDNKTKIPSR